jgi:hypothetical protein
MKKSRPIIWTKEARELLYAQLVHQFGAYATWGKSASPGNGQDAAFDDFCRGFAKIIGANSGDAVRHQIAFALPISGKAHWDKSLSRNAIMNLCPAMQSGFITVAQLPNLEATPGKYKRRSDNV